MNADGSNRRTLLASERASGPDWSPDGRREIVFAEFAPNATAIAAVDAAGGSPVRLTETSGVQTDPAWSPDGKRIAFSRLGVGNGIYVMNADGTGLRRLTYGGHTDRSPAWRPVARPERG